MPFINVKMVEGRTSEQKKQLVAAITQSMVDICNATPESTMVTIEDIAKDKGLSPDDLIKEIETIVDSGTKLNLQYMLDSMIDDYEQEELWDFFKESENFSLEEARQEFSEEEYSDEQIRIARVQFISNIGN